jgi:ATP-dependent protease Clp ATPase subunit
VSHLLFFGKSQDGRKLIAGSAAYICEDSVRRCIDVREQRESSRSGAA